MTSVSSGKAVTDPPTVNVGDLEAHLTDYLRRVREGEEIAIVDGDIVIGHLIPAPPSTFINEEARLQDLVRRGIITRGSGGIPDEFWTMKRPEDPTGSVRKALEEEREGGR